MREVCLTNNWVSHGIAIALQVLFITIFLTLFFFFYVVNVEKSEFKKQMNMVVNKLMANPELSGIIPKHAPLDELFIAINGALDLAQEKITYSVQSAIKEVIERNKKTRNRSIHTLLILSAFVIIIILSLMVIGFCMPISDHITNGLIAVFFVAITEFIFLTIVAKQYWSTDPNRIQRELGRAIKKYIKNRKNQK